MKGVSLFSEAGTRACAASEPSVQPPELAEDWCGHTFRDDRPEVLPSLRGQEFQLLRDECADPRCSGGAS